MKTYETLKELIEQLELPNYQTKDELHKLTSNAAFKQLKALSQVNNLCLSDVSGLLPLENTIEELEQMSNNYEVVDGCYVIQKHTFDAYIERLEALKQ